MKQFFKLFLLLFMGNLIVNLYGAEITPINNNQQTERDGKKHSNRDRIFQNYLFDHRLPNKSIDLTEQDKKAYRSFYANLNSIKNYLSAYLHADILPIILSYHSDPLVRIAKKTEYTITDSCLMHSYSYLSHISDDGIAQLLIEHHSGRTIGQKCLISTNPQDASMDAFTIPDHVFAGVDPHSIRIDYRQHNKRFYVVSAGHDILGYAHIAIISSLTGKQVGLPIHHDDHISRIIDINNSGTYCLAQMGAEYAWIKLSDGTKTVLEGDFTNLEYPYITHGDQPFAFVRKKDKEYVYDTTGQCCKIVSRTDALKELQSILNHPLISFTPHPTTIPVTLVAADSPQISFCVDGSRVSPNGKYVCLRYRKFTADPEVSSSHTQYILAIYQLEQLTQKTEIDKIRSSTSPTDIPSEARILAAKAAGAAVAALRKSQDKPQESCIIS